MAGSGQAENRNSVCFSCDGRNCITWAITSCLPRDLNQEPGQTLNTGTPTSHSILTSRPNSKWLLTKTKSFWWIPRSKKKQMSLLIKGSYGVRHTLSSAGTGTLKSWMFEVHRTGKLAAGGARELCMPGPSVRTQGDTERMNTGISHFPPSDPLSPISVRGQRELWAAASESPLE